MLRKLSTLILCLVAAVATASAQTPPDNEIWYTTIVGSKIHINTNNLVSNSYNNGRGVLKFRDRVTSIGYKAFEGCYSLKSITIPESVTSIGDWAFYGCSCLTSVIIPNSVTTIGERAFSICTSLTSVTIPDSVTTIGEDAFSSCSSLTSITIPNSVTEIASWAFYNCSSLTSITIPDGVTEIGEYAFFGCSSLKSVTISESVTRIGKSAFSGCSSLTSITIPESVTEIASWAFAGCSSLKSFKGKFASTDGRCLIKDGKLIAFAPAGLTSYTIPESVTNIEKSAFEGCYSLKSITIPESVTSIGDWAFYGCSSLKSVKVSNKYCYDYFKKLGVSDITFMISTLEEYEEAQKLGATKITIDSKYASEDGLCLIDNGELILFIGKDLTKYTIPEGVTSFRKEAFKGCSSLTSITIPNSVTEIASWAFKGCISLTSITIPNSVTCIGEEAFEGCSSLKSVKVSNKYCYDYFTEKVTDIAFYGANATADGRCLIVNGELQRFIGKGVTEYSIPESVTSIGEDAFYGCSSLELIIIPKSVTSIGEDAFYDCSSLRSIACLATTPPAISYISSEKTILILIPKKAVKAYKKDPKWSIYKKQIKPIK